MSAQELFPYLTQALSTLILGGILYGVSQRKNRRRHVPVMLACFAGDMGLLLLVQLVESAVQTTVAGGYPFVLKVHLCFSIPLVFAWLAQVVLGWQRLRGKCRRAHRLNAVVLLTLRFGNWFTSFFV